MNAYHLLDIFFVLIAFLLFSLSHTLLFMLSLMHNIANNANTYIHTHKPLTTTLWIWVPWTFIFSYFFIYILSFLNYSSLNFVLYYVVVLMMIKLSFFLSLKSIYTFETFKYARKHLFLNSNLWSLSSELRKRREKNFVLFSLHFNFIHYFIFSLNYDFYLYFSLNILKTISHRPY